MFVNKLCKIFFWRIFLIMRKKLIFNVLGVMTGTSMDGIDISLVKTNGTNYVKILSEKSYIFNKNYQNILKKLILNKPKKNNKIKEYFLKKNNYVTKIIEKNIIKFINKNNINKKKIDLISISGQTVYHNPEKKISIQLGDGESIAKKLQLKTISNLRDRDIINGGQGAPIGAYYHKYLIKKLKEKILILNLGGIANYSVISSNKLLSSDIGPANCLIDDLSVYFFNKKFDKNGSSARKGEINYKLINIFKNDKFFQRSFPKSLDRNYFHKYFNKLIKINKYDALKTANYMTCISLQEFIKKNNVKFDKIILTGGGRKNKYLLEILNDQINKKIDVIDNYKIDGDLVESQMFAYIGMRSYKKLIISSKNTTGVKKNTSGGKLYKPY